MDTGQNPTSDPAHPSGSLVPEANFGWNVTIIWLLLLQSLAFDLISGSLPFSPHAACFLHLCAILSSKKKKKILLTEAF